MQRSSASIGNLAAALAKAQVELVNPEKSQEATIQVEGQKGSSRSFRYAPLSSGLEIVRKALGQREIATLQTTAVDQTAGIVNLTTVLAHASGEWIASDWPICPISETTHPHRLGAALTYARRYGLFTLVGIAGEDDIDAPDISGPVAEPEPEKAVRGQSRNGQQLNGSSAARRHGRAEIKAADPPLTAERSAELRSRLIAEIARLEPDSEELAKWAHRRLGDKTRLGAADAELVEGAFAARLAMGSREHRAAETSVGAAPTSISKDVNSVVESAIPAGQLASPGHDAKSIPSGRAYRPEGIDKSALPLSEPKRIRDREHTRLVARQNCLLCGRQPCDVHHLRFAQARAMGRKVSDEFTVPLCRGHHREVHRYGDEAQWWRKTGFDPLDAARALWLQSHPQLSAPRPPQEGGSGPSNSNERLLAG